MTDITADRLVDAYVKIRTKRSELKAAFEEEDSALVEKQKKISQALLQICKDTGVESIRTKHGTMTKVVKERYWCTDFGPFIQYVKENDAYHLLEQRVAQLNMKAWIKDHPDDLPPAVNCERSFDVQVRKPRKELE
jgi:hypothetical protein